MLLAALALSACHRADTAAPPAAFEHNGDRIVVPAGSALRSQLELGAATADSIRQRLTVPAVVEAVPEKFAHVYPPLTGHLQRLHVQLGEKVAEGQLVATLQSGDFTSAQGDYIKAKSAFTLAEKEIRREQALYEARIAATKDLEQAQNDFDNAQSDLQATLGRLRSFGFDPAKDALGGPLSVFSPVAGTVVEIDSALNEFHNDPTVALMTIADLSTVWLTANVPENDLRFLHPEEEIEATVTAYPNETFRGKVRFIGDLIDPDTHTAKVRAVFENPGSRLKPGMFATVQFLDFPATRITVPAAAPVQIGSTTFIYVESSPWEFIPRQVKLGSQLGGRIIVEEGVEAKATVIAKGAVLLQ